MSAVVRGFITSGMPHTLLAPERSPAWTSLRAAYDRAREEIARTEADVILYYSTQWVSVIGHQIQADPEPEWVHVDQEWHELGSMKYRFRTDVEFAAAYEKAATARGLHARQVAFRGFPVDTGTIVAQQLLNPDNRLPFGVVSCNMYADRAETLVLGKAAHDALQATGKRAVAVAVTSLSNRFFTHEIDPVEDRISSLKDDEWNRKLLEILGKGRLEDVAQLAREFTIQANGDSKLKAIWWLAALMGQHNNYDGQVLGYEPVWGTGACVVSLTPSQRAAAVQEFDEEDADTFHGERSVLATDDGSGGKVAARPAGKAPASPRGPVATSASGSTDPRIMAASAPSPVGAYPHARRVGDLLYLSGVGPRQTGTDEIPGGPVRSQDGEPLDYDVAAQTRAVIENVRFILEEAGSSLENILDITVFLIDMDRDFEAYNRVYNETFAAIGPTRTTLAIKALPTPIAVEFKVIAAAEKA